MPANGGGSSVFLVAGIKNGKKHIGKEIPGNMGREKTQDTPDIWKAMMWLGFF